MTNFIINIAEGAYEKVKEALSSVGHALEPVETTIIADVEQTFQAFLAKFGPAEAKTILSSLSTALDSGVKAGLRAATSGTLQNAEDAAKSAAQALSQ